MQVVSKIAKEPEAVEALLSKLMKKLKSTKDGSLKSVFISGCKFFIIIIFFFVELSNIFIQVMQMATASPQSIAPYNEYFMTLIENKDQIWTMAAMILQQSAKYNIEPCINSFETFIDLVDEGPMNLANIGSILEGIAEKDPSLFDGDMLKMLESHETNASTGYFVWSIYGKVAKDEGMKKKMSNILDRVEARTAEFMTLSTAYGLVDFVGNFCFGSEASVVRGLKLLRKIFDLIGTVNAAYQGTVVLKMKTLCTGPGIPKTVIDPYLADFQRWSESSDTGTRECAKAIVAYREGKDLDSVVQKVDQVESKVDEQGKKIEKVEKDVTEIKTDVAQVKVEVKEANTKATNAENLAKQASVDAQDAKTEARQAKEEVKQVSQEVKETKQLAQETASRVDKVESDVKEVKEDVSHVKDVANKMEDALKELQDIREYIDSRIAEVKDFIAEVVKKLPLPCSFSDEGLIIKKITLYFECSSKCSPSCLYPGPDKAKRFTTQTKTVHKWLKVAFSAIQLGKAIWENNPIDALGAIKSAYDACMEQYDKDFKAFCSEPFLTSEEQDNLINQLRDASFFNYFTYDAQNAGWECSRCCLHKKDEKAQKEYEKQVAKGGDASPPPPKPQLNPVTKQGVLCHQAAHVKRSWKSNTWKLTPSTFGYGELKKEKALPVTDIQNVTSVAAEKVSFKQNVFSVAYAKRIYYIQASNAQERDEWIEAIKNNILCATKSQEQK